MGLCLTGLSHFQIRFESFIRPFPSFPAHKLSPEWENQGVLPGPPAEKQCNQGHRTHILSGKGDLHVRGVSKPTHYRLMFFTEKVNPVTSALRQFLLVTAPELHWWGADENITMNQATHWISGVSPPLFQHCIQDPVLRKMWDNLS